MPRFFFHVQDEVDTLDHDGVEFGYAEAARHKAAARAGELIRDRGWKTGRWQMQVTDAAGRAICRISVVAEVDEVDSGGNSADAMRDGDVAPRFPAPALFSATLHGLVETLQSIEAERTVPACSPDWAAEPVFGTMVVKAMTVHDVSTREHRLKRIFRDFMGRPRE